MVRKISLNCKMARLHKFKCSLFPTFLKGDPQSEVDWFLSTIMEIRSLNPRVVLKLCHNFAL